MECPGIFAALFSFFDLCPIWRPSAGQALALADSRILWYTQESTPVTCGDYYRKASRGNGIPQPPPHSPLPPLFNMTNSIRIKNTILCCLSFILLYVLTASFSLLHVSWIPSPFSTHSWLKHCKTLKLCIQIFSISWHDECWRNSKKHYWKISK